MNEDYRQGFDDALESMYWYLERIDLQSKQCKKLCDLMNMIGEWNNRNTYEDNIKFAHEQIEEVRMRAIMSNSYYSIFYD